MPRQAKVAVGTTTRIAYNYDVALRVIEAVASGEKPADIWKRKGMPTRGTWITWLEMYPQLRDAYARARELSAEAFEDRALELAEDVLGPELTGTGVRAREVAMGQLRWSAERRNRRLYGPSVHGQIIVPVQINTTLDLGQEGGGALAQDNPDALYQLDIQTPASTPAQEEPLPLALADQTPATIAQALTPVDPERLSAYDMFGAKVTPQGKRRPGRPRKGHKTPAGTKKTATMYARQAARKTAEAIGGTSTEGEG